MEEELSKELELEIKGTEKPSLWNLLGVRFILLPYTFVKVKTSILSANGYIYYAVIMVHNLSFSSCDSWFLACARLNRLIWFFSSAISVVWMLVLEVQGERGSIFLGRCCLPHTEST